MCGDEKVGSSQEGGLVGSSTGIYLLHPPTKGARARTRAHTHTVPDFVVPHMCCGACVTLGPHSQGTLCRSWHTGPRGLFDCVLHRSFLLQLWARHPVWGAQNSSRESCVQKEPLISIWDTEKGSREHKIKTEKKNVYIFGISFSQLYTPLAAGKQ